VNVAQQVVFAFEAERRLRIAVLGTSGHALRNYLPVLPFLPVEYVAQWDAKLDRARAFAQQFGARAGPNAAFDDLDKLLAAHRPEAVWITTDDLDSEGRPLQPQLVERCLDAGCHVFCDKPLASSAEQVRRLIQRRDALHRTVGVGIKTMHYPTHSRVREIVADPAAGFGELNSVFIRYPLRVPSRAGLPPSDETVRACLSHIWHPIGAALRIGDRLSDVYLRIDARGRNAVLAGTYRSGAALLFHFAASASGTSPLEFLEAVGEGTNITVENAVRLTYYRRASLGRYGRTTDALTTLEDGPLRWEPEFSLGQLYNDHNFIQGYAQSLMHFTAAALAGTPTTVGTLEDALEIVKVYERLCEGPGILRTIGEN
jgi:predicted dehydrogenase